MVVIDALSLERLFRQSSLFQHVMLPNTRDVGSASLTRFNKIATQGAPQMAVDKEANSLSRVYSYYSKFNLCLFYVKPALARYLSILFLNILTLLACTQSVDNLFHTLMVLWENEYFLTSNLLCFFTSV